MTVLLLTVVSIVLAGIAVLPGSLGILKLTYKLTATSRGAFIVFRLSLPVYIVSLVLLASAGFVAVGQEGSLPTVFIGILLVGGISVFGFLMHVSFMFKPIRKPSHISLDEAIKRFGDKEEVVGVIDGHGNPYAYIARLQRRPHIIFEPNAETPFISSHCILAHSSMAYELSGDFTEPEICISSALANNLVFYEKNRHWSVQQIYNSTRDGNNHLQTLPTVMTSLGRWQQLYPESKIWVRQTEWRDTFYLKLLARASVIDPQSPDLVYPLQHEVDTRLPLKSYVNGVQIGDDVKAYPLDLFRDQQVVEDALGGEHFVFFASTDADFVQLFSPKLAGGKSATFRTSNDNSFEDIETGSIWDLKGECIEGKLRGQKLRAIPHYNKIFWFCWADFFPMTSIYEKTEKMHAAHYE